MGIMKRQVQMHSRSRCERVKEAKRKGRHNGYGKRKGTRNARMPSKVIWMRRTRVLRRLLKKYREAKKINKDIYHHFYVTSKGNLFKNKNVLIEAIHKMKQERSRPPRRNPRETTERLSLWVSSPMMHQKPRKNECTRSDIHHPQDPNLAITFNHYVPNELDLV